MTRTKQEAIIAETIAIVVEGVCMVLVFACAFVWLAIYATRDAAPVLAHLG